MKNTDKIILDRILTYLAADTTGLTDKIFDYNTKFFREECEIWSREEFGNWVSTVELGIDYSK